MEIGASSFKLLHDAPDALLSMSGRNDIRTNGGSASLNFISGITRVTPRSAGDFTLRVIGNTTTSFVAGKKSILTIKQMEDRDNTLPLIDLTQATGHKTFIVEDGATLDITRILKPLPNNRYLLVDGLDPSSTVQTGEITYLSPSGYTKYPMFENNGTQLWLDEINVPDAFDPQIAPPNLAASEDCATRWLNHTANGLALRPYEVLALRKDFHSGPPEAAVDMAIVGVDINSTSVKAAKAGFLDHGVYSVRQGQFRFWSNYMGAVNRTRDHNRYSGYNVHTDGVLLGVAWEPSPVFALGGYIGYSQSDTKFRSISADADSESTHAGLQASYMSPWGIRVTADGSFSHHAVDMTRSPGGLGYDTGSFGQDVVGTGLEVAYDIQMTEKTRFTPAASIEAAWMWQDAFAEKGRIMAARVDKVQGSSVASYLGGTLEHDFVFEDGVVTPGAGVRWKHQYAGRQRSADYAFVDNCNADYSCVAKSRKLGSDSLDLSAYIIGKVRTENAEWSIRGGYGLEVGNKSVGHTFYAGIAASF